ncbi:MAG: outer membrane lipid asymmetry maintenance protein MlaD [Hyphomonadaceae bacterium]
MRESTAETILGAIVAAVAVGFFIFASAQARQGESGAAGSYNLIARFQNVSGISVGSDVRVSGVKVGAVRDIRIDPQTYLAQLTFSIAPDIELSEDSTARIQSDGLLGGAYVSIEPGGGEPLTAGGEIINTQGAVDLLTLLASAASSMGGNNRSEDPATPAPQEAAP